jgi:hypothetical protein
MNMFKEIFKGLERAHGCTKVSGSNRKWSQSKRTIFCSKSASDRRSLEKHLQGTQSLGIIPINEDNQCIWGCVDIDSYAGFDHKKLIDKIKNYNLPLGGV